MKFTAEISITPHQLEALVNGLSFYEQLCRGDLQELSILMERDIVVNYTASNEPRCPVGTAQLNAQVKPLIDRASHILGYAPGARLSLPQLEKSSVMHLLSMLEAILSPAETPNEETLPFCHKEAGRYIVRITAKQAYALKNALDVYVRVCLGQFTIVTEAVLAHEILCYAPDTSAPKPLSTEQCWGPFQERMMDLKRALGFPADGSYGIGNPHVHVSAHRSYEILKVLSKALSEHREPNAAMVLRGVDFDGLRVRYTDDPAPQARIVG